MKLLSLSSIPLFFPLFAPIVYLLFPHPPPQDITAQARKFAKAMKAPIVFCSASHGINVIKLFKLVFEKVFGLETDIEIKSGIGEPILEY